MVGQIFELTSVDLVMLDRKVIIHGNNVLGKLFRWIAPHSGVVSQNPITSNEWRTVIAGESLLTITSVLTAKGCACNRNGSHRCCDSDKR